jgi:hypothetical protein
MGRWWHRIRAWWWGSDEDAERTDAYCLNPILLDALYEELQVTHYQRLRVWEQRALLCLEPQGGGEAASSPALAREIERLAGRIRVLLLQLQRLAHLEAKTDAQIGPDPTTCQRLRRAHGGVLGQKLGKIEEAVEACGVAGWRVGVQRAAILNELTTTLRAVSAEIAADISRLAWTLPRSQACLDAWVDGDAGAGQQGTATRAEAR